MRRPVAFGTLALTAVVLILTAQNCAPGSFTEAPKGTPPVMESGGGDNAESNVEQGEIEPEDPGLEVPAPPIPLPNPAASLPKISFDLEMCADYSDCSKKMTLSFAHTKTISFKWKTSETAAAARPEIFCQPDVGYIPTSGYLTYNPGDTIKTVQVRSLSCGNTKQIPLTILDCKLNGVAFSCLDLIP